MGFDAILDEYAPAFRSFIFLSLFAVVCCCVFERFVNFCVIFVICFML